MMAVPMKGIRCPACKAGPLDSTALDADVPGPVPGDVSICAYCSALLIFDGEPLRLRLPTPTEEAQLRAVPYVAQILEAARLARISRGIPTRPKLN